MMFGGSIPVSVFRAALGGDLKLIVKLVSQGDHETLYRCGKSCGSVCFLIFLLKSSVCPW